ncbi:MAG: hypothetical protein KUL80_07525 [Comamonas sp.]|nr:hypothetical protein [Comamonas sp.]
MWASIVQFWQNNSANIVVSLLVGFVFFVLGPIGLWFSGKKIRRERSRKAKDVLIDLLEGMIVNHAPIDETKLRALFRSVEREIDVDLSGDYHIDHWLGDVALRFERSRHLSPNQKQDYYEVVRALADELQSKTQKKPALEVPRKYESVLNDLKSSISSGNLEIAASAAEELERTMLARERSHDPLLNIFRVYHRMYQRSPVTFVAALVVVTIVYIVILVRYLPKVPF